MDDFQMHDARVLWPVYMKHIICLYEAGFSGLEKYSISIAYNIDLCIVLEFWVVWVWEMYISISLFHLGGNILYHLITIDGRTNVCKTSFSY